MTTTQILPGPAGDLEILLGQPVGAVRPGVALICHPHPLFGGTMHNKVVYTAARAFEEVGIKTLRFNYRGVEKSAGQYGEGIGETDDALFLYDWLKTEYPDEPIYLVGFSFGGYVAARVATFREVAALIAIAPSAENFDWRVLNITCPWLLIHAQADEIVNPDAVAALQDRFSVKPTFASFSETGHFFHGKLTLLRATIVEWLNSFL